MKILCLCSRGNKRSVFTRYLLSYKNDVLSAGCENNSPETLKMLAWWADVILLAEPQMRKVLPVKTHKKIDTRFEIGKDIYPTMITGVLKQVLQVKLKRLNYI